MDESVLAWAFVAFYILVGIGFGGWIGHWVFRDYRAHNLASFGVALVVGGVTGLLWPITLPVLLLGAL